VNIVETRHKVFPILGEASSPSNYFDHLLLLGPPAQSHRLEIKLSKTTTTTVYYSVSNVLWKAIAFPFSSAIGQPLKQEHGFSSVISDRNAFANLLDKFNGRLAPCAAVSTGAGNQA